MFRIENKKTNKKHITILLILLILFITLVTFVFLSLNKKDNISLGDQIVGEAVESAKVQITNKKFEPRKIKLKKGGKIEWINNDDVNHMITSDDGIFNSGDLKTSESFTFQFEKSGKYIYRSVNYPEFEGLIEVV